MLGNEDTEKRNVMVADQISKTVFSEVRILAEFVRDVIPEFGGFTTEQIIDAVRRRKEYPRGLNTENVLPSLDTVRYDLLYRVPVPGSEGEVAVLVNIESQSRTEYGYPIEKRALYYLTSIFTQQKGEVFRNSDYGSLETVYSLWIHLNPPAALRGTMKTGSFRWTVKGPEGEKTTGDPSMINCIMLYMGDEGHPNPVRAMDILQTLFRKNDRDTIGEDLINKFNIELNNYYIAEVRSTGEIVDGYISYGRDIGREEGRARLVSVLTEAVINFMDLGKSLEEALALAHVPDDCVDEVREAVLARTN